jgi:cytoskeletal protein CcmA (bactofilin family)
MASKGKPVPASSSKTSCLPKTLIGCGCLALLSLLLVIVSLAGLAFWGMRQFTEYSDGFVAQGYESRMGQMIEETETVAGPKVYTAQVVKIHKGVDGDLALMCQIAEIDGTVSGNLDFMGQVLVIKPGARITGRVEVNKAQVVLVQGIVEGDVVVLVAQTVEIGPDSIVHGDVHAKAVQSLKVQGQLLGDINGQPAIVERPDAAKPRRIELPAEEEAAEVTIEEELEL